jgi:hypothetical protein
VAGVAAQPVNASALATRAATAIRAKSLPYFAIFPPQRNEWAIAIEADAAFDDA